MTKRDEALKKAEEVIERIGKPATNSDQNLEIYAKAAFMACYDWMTSGERTPIIQIICADAAGPDSNINLNTSCLFYREGKGEWIPIDERSGIKVRQAVRDALRIVPVKIVELEK